MKIKLLYVLLFLIVNVFLVLLHLWIFKTSWPFAAWVTVIIHLLLLIAFPYKKLTTNENH
jgi:hypothetical protein